MEVSEEGKQGTFTKIFDFIKKAVIFIIVIGIAGFVVIFLVGSQTIHRDNNNFLYDCFDTSPEHAALLAEMAKSRLSILYGRKEAGLFQFAEHYANNLSLAGRNVFVEDISKKHFKLYRVASAARSRLDKWLGIQKEKGDWFIYSRDGNIVPFDVINKIRTGNPSSKIVIVTTSLRQRNAGFKEFSFPQVDEHQIEESIERNFDVDENTADILYDYFETAQNAFNAFSNMNIDKFSHEKFLGDNYRSLEGLSREDNRILKDLCKKGEGHSNSESLILTELGVVHYEGENYWKNADARLNYELHKKLNCKNKLIPDTLLKQAEELRERQAEQQRKRQQQEQKALALEAQMKAKKQSKDKNGKNSKKNQKK